MMQKRFILKQSQENNWDAAPSPGDNLGTSRNTKCSFPMGDKRPPEPLVSISLHSLAEGKSWSGQSPPEATLYFHMMSDSQMINPRRKDGKTRSSKVVKPQHKLKLFPSKKAGGLTTTGRMKLYRASKPCWENWGKVRVNGGRPWASPAHHEERRGACAVPV
ncbi:small nuclear ribonucleoprotein E isoform X2 [Kogia breviceps]|uniref:small nuclear ribonucleoprotein E isoform X2 n=1 Tax=Kogia breviceps TaxID=27615 RepID=UPI0034D214D6